MNGIHGEKIKFTIDDYVLALIREIDKEYKSINFKKVSSMDNIILECYSSATIEGANTTIDNIKRKDVKDKDTLMAKNCIEVIKKIKCDKEVECNEANLIKVWKHIVKDVCENKSAMGSKYRDKMVYVANHIPQKPEHIEDSMNELFEIINSNNIPVIKASIAHFYLVYIHPFCDGNGRTARLLFSWILYNSGYKDIFSIPISNTIMNNVNNYYKSIAKCEIVNNKEIDISEHIIFMLQILLSSIKLISGGTSFIESKIFNIMKKHDGAELTVDKCSKLLKISKQKARYTLNKMVYKDVLIKYKVKNKYYYRINIIK